MTSWKQLFGEPVVILYVVQAGLQTVNWTTIHNSTIQIVVSVVLGIIGALLTRAQVTPTAKITAVQGHLDPES